MKICRNESKTAQVAWLNRQLFGRKSEKLRIYDPNMPDLFAEEFAGLRHQTEEKAGRGRGADRKGTGGSQEAEASEPQNDRGSARARNRGHRTDGGGFIPIP